MLTSHNTLRAPGPVGSRCSLRPQVGPPSPAVFSACPLPTHTTLFLGMSLWCRLRSSVAPCGWYQGRGHVLAQGPQPFSLPRAEAGWGEMQKLRYTGTSPYAATQSDSLSLAPALPQMTGRKGRVVSRSDGTVAFESRAEQGLSIDHVNLREKERFMRGEKVGDVEAGTPVCQCTWVGRKS